jgi:putative ABC transport system permease protein
MEEERIWKLFAKQLKEEISTEERRELHDLLKQNPEAGYPIQIISAFWKPAELENKKAADEAFTRHLQRMTGIKKYQSPPSIAKKGKSFGHLINGSIMFRNYLKIAIRNLQKQKVFAFINVLGLSLGIACVSLLLLFVINEFSFDKFHKNGVDIYRFYSKMSPSDNAQEDVVYTDYSGPTATTIGESMKKELPDVIDFARLQLPWGDNLIRTEKNAFRTGVTYADPSFFRMFSFPLKYGSAASALRDINDVVLTESKAKEFFGSDNVVGKTIEISIGAAFLPFTVSAVAQDPPPNSSIRFEVLGNFRFAAAHNGQFYIGRNWHPIVSQTYVQLKRGSKLPADAKQLDRFLLSFDPNVIANAKSAGVSWKGNILPLSFKLQPLLSIHTDSWFHGWGFSDHEVIDPKTIWILLAIASAILLIACINFTTLAIGRSSGRIKEVGIRKVIGGKKNQIVIQFLTESVMLSFFSGILGLVLAYAVLPLFNRLSGEGMHFSLLLNPKIMLLLAGLILTVGVLTGSYPSLVLSGFKPIEVLKNKIRIGGSNVFTKSLVTFQFALSITLIISTIVILQQSNYLINKDPGFHKENVIVVDASETDANKAFPIFRQSLINQPKILGVASAAAGLGAGHDLLGYSDKGLSADINVIDTSYIRVLGMQFLAGNNFRPGQGNDSLNPMIINETMMRAFGWDAQNAVGKEIKGFQGGTALVVGVVKNFNYRPLSEGVRNQAFLTNKDKGYNNFYVRISTGSPSSALASIQKAWGSTVPGIPIKYSFLDEDVNNFYKTEQKWSSIIAWAAGISIFLACLGLLGLAALAAVNRTKEIGVRKVLGASITGIIMLLSRDFLRLVFISFVIATPVAWYLMNRWLQDYVNRIDISWAVFVSTGVFVIIISMFTIGFQAIKAAIANPVNSLRRE